MQPKVQSFEEIMAELNPLYDPSRQAINNQITNVQQQQLPGVNAINNQKNLEFENIAQTAQNRGVFFGGFQPNEQAKYVGSTFLPAMAQLQSGINTQTNNLTGQLAELDAGVRTAAQTRQGQQATAMAAWEQQQQALALEQQKLAQQMAIAQMQDRTSRAGMAASSAGGLTANQALQAQQEAQKFNAANYKVIAKGNNQGFAYQGPSGQSISANAYANATGQNLLSVLSQDTTPYAQAVAAMIKGDWGAVGKLTSPVLYQAGTGGMKGYDVKKGLPTPPASVRTDPVKLENWIIKNYPALF